MGCKSRVLSVGEEGNSLPDDGQCRLELWWRRARVELDLKQRSTGFWAGSRSWEELAFPFRTAVGMNQALLSSHLAEVATHAT